MESKVKVGILGGGQLAQMLAEVASKVNVEPIVFDSSTNCPASEFASKVVVGKMNCQDLENFCSSVDLTLFESEFVDVPLLEQVKENLQKSGKSFNCLPSLETMKILQDKLSQKELCIKSDCPTSDYRVIDKTKNITEEITRISNDFSEGAVLKWSRNGYDGKGNFFVNDWQNQLNEIIAFCNAGYEKNAVVYAEEKINFKRELAVVCVRAKDKTIFSYPVVVSEQTKGTCLNVFGPAQEFGVSEEICQEVINTAKKIGASSDIVGAYAVELFETVDGKILVNEIAPRVHNTGHYTQEAFSISQFENHLRASLGLDISASKPKSKLFGMRNILGPINISKEECNPPKSKLADEVALHWYNKQGTRPGRKLGHINVVANDKDLFNKNWELALKAEKDWIDSL